MAAGAPAPRDVTSSVASAKRHLAAANNTITIDIDTDDTITSY